MSKSLLASVLLTLGLLPGLSAFAGEELPDLGSTDPKVKEVLKRYVDKSRGHLKKLDSLIEGNSDNTVDGWMSEVAEARSDISSAGDEAMALCKESKVPKAQTSVIEEWLLAEYSAWQSVESIGAMLAYSRDDLVRYIDMTKKAIPEVEAKRKAISLILKRIEYAATGLAAVTGFVIEPSATVAVLTAAALTLEKAVDLATGEKLRVEALVKVLVRQDAEIRAFAAEASPAARKAAIEKAIRQDVDPDQRGVFFDHERRWEKSLLKFVDDFDAEYKKYEAKVKPALEGKITSAVSWLNGLSFKDFAAKFIQTTNEAEAAFEVLEETIEEKEEAEK